MAGELLVDFSPRRDHGTDAAMNAARAAAIAGSAGTSNLAATMRYGLKPVGTMAHSYVMSFEREEDAGRSRKPMSIVPRCPMHHRPRHRRHRLRPPRPSEAASHPPATLGFSSTEAVAPFAKALRCWARRIR
jgi:Nicotinate phosphoribosyltransferase (NAPRTase) family